KGNLMLFDIVTANPPFSLDKWGHDDAAHDKFGRFTRGIPPKTKGDYAFILHMIETLKPKTGGLGVVVPHGVLFRGSSEGNIRQQLIDENLLDAVIGLPEKLFYGTGIPAAILIFRKDRPRPEPGTPRPEPGTSHPELVEGRCPEPVEGRCPEPV